MKIFNWMRDHHDARDHLYHQKFTLTSPTALPAIVDLRAKFPAPYDQGELGSCTAHALVGALQYDHIKNNADAAMLSRLFVYYNERSLEGKVAQDSGAYLRDGIKSLVTQGVCVETDWPYVAESFAVKPPAKAYSDALKYKITDYTRITDLNSMLNCLASGYPFVFGFNTYSDFQSEYVEKTGILPMPDTTTPCLGGHAVCAVGYDQTKKVFVIRNSWGVNWGQQGYFTMPFDYLTRPDLASDFWMIRK